jgi:hypothetical protein
VKVLTARAVALRLLLLTGLLLATIALGVCAGPSAPHGVDALRALVADDATPAADIVLRVRLPRVLLAAVVGAALAAAGALFQALLRNPLADPYVLGVSGGAAVGGILALSFGPALGFGAQAVPPAAFAGALLTTAVLVLDPVIRSSSGTRLLDEDGERVLRLRLLPLATLVTPNLSEAAALSGLSVTDPESMLAAARCIAELGPEAVLVTGGHLGGADVVDVLVHDSKEHVWRYPRIESKGTHGTGCTLSAAVTAGLAQGRTLHRATLDAIEYVRRAIAKAPGIGRGDGPLDPFPDPIKATPPVRSAPE